jgi:hypothetical protein
MHATKLEKNPRAENVKMAVFSCPVNLILEQLQDFSPVFKN